MAAMLRLRAGLLSTAVLCAGCSTYQTFDSVGHLRGLYEQRVGAAAAQVVVPFEVDEATRAALPQRRQPTPLRRLNQVMELIFERLDLRYELAPTRTAVETFVAR